jgi:hypothetical protein
LASEREHRDGHDVTWHGDITQPELTGRPVVRVPRDEAGVIEANVSRVDDEAEPVRLEQGLLAHPCSGRVARARVAFARVQCNVGEAGEVGSTLGLGVDSDPPGIGERDHGQVTRVGDAHLRRVPHRRGGNKKGPAVLVAPAPGALVRQDDVRGRHVVEPRCLSTQELGGRQSGVRND